MPYYSFKNLETEEEFELSMKMSELDPYLKKNKKKIIQIFTKMHTGDPWLLDGVMKPPADFSKYVLGKVKHGTAGANIEQGRYHVTKEI